MQQRLSPQRFLMALSRNDLDLKMQDSNILPTYGSASRWDTMFGVKNALVEVNPGKLLVPPMFRDFEERIVNFRVRSDDVWILAYPRTGTTWTTEMTWCIINNLDFKAARSKEINLRCPLLELSVLFGHDELVTKMFKDSVALAESLPSPRCIKSHLPLTVLPRTLATVKPKIVCVLRNPKDVCVSYYHYCKLLHNLQGCSFEEFCEHFLKGEVPIGSYLDNVLAVWEMRHELNVIFMKYETMKRDLKGSAAQLATFLGKDLPEDQLSRLVEHASFEKMKENPALNLEDVMTLKHGPEHDHFIRKGQVGDWKNHMSENMSTRFDQWIHQKLAGSGLEFE